MDYPFVSVLLATFNRKEWLRECLVSLSDQNYPKDRFEVIVINDGSTDGTEEVLEEHKRRAPHAFRWYSQENRGKAAAINLGIGKTRGEIICFTDDDCIADRNWIRSLLKEFSDERVGGAGGQIIAYRPKNHVERYGVFFDQEGSISLATGNAAYRADIIKAVGGFDTRLIGLEDIDFGVRVRGRGYKLKYAPGAIVYHRNYNSLGKLVRRKYLEGKQLYNLGTKYKHYFNARKLMVKFSLGAVRRILFPDLYAILRSGNKEKYILVRLFEAVILVSTLLGLIAGAAHKEIYCYRGDKVLDRYDFEFE
ncbi:MAG: glycosyltransferase [Candidatus Methanoperedens sp.]|nr:glycosyltransferase [Candidatus Methanoperedens sp.]